MQKLTTLFSLIILCIQAFAQLPADSLNFQNISRKWYENIPPNYNGGSPVPLVIALHGGLGNGLNFSGSSGWKDISDTAGFITVFPNGAISQGPGFVWNLFSWDSTYSFYNSFVDDVGFIDTLIGRLQIKYNIDCNRIYLTGFSNGCSMAITYAFAHANRLAALGAVSGSFMTSVSINPYTNPFQPDTTLPVWIFRGETENQQVPGTVETRKVSDQNQKNYWLWRNYIAPIPSVASTFSDALYSYKDTTFNSTTEPGLQVKFTEVVGQYHQMVPEYAVRIWTEFFSNKTRNCLTTTAIHNIENGHPILKIFPNPTNSFINISSTQILNQISIYNLLGENILNLVPDKSETTIDVSNLSKGIYFIKATTEKNLITQKLIIH